MTFMSAAYSWTFSSLFLTMFAFPSLSDFKVLKSAPTALLDVPNTKGTFRTNRGNGMPHMGLPIFLGSGDGSVMGPNEDALVLRRPIVHSENGC